MKKTNLSNVRQNRKKKATGKVKVVKPAKTAKTATKKTVSKAVKTAPKRTAAKQPVAKKTVKPAPKKTVAKKPVAIKPVAKKATKSATKKTVSKAVKKTAYRKSTDKVGDVLVNQAGIKYKITGERYAAPSGYNDGKLKIRMLEITPEKKTGLKPFETNDATLTYYKQQKVLKRVKNGERK